MLAITFSVFVLWFELSFGCISTVSPDDSNDNSDCQLCLSLYVENCGTTGNSICPTESEASFVHERVDGTDGYCRDSWSCPFQDGYQTYAHVTLASGTVEILSATGEATCEDYPNNVWTLNDGREITAVTCAEDPDEVYDNSNCQLCANLYLENCGTTGKMFYCATTAQANFEQTRTTGANPVCKSTWSCPVLVGIQTKTFVTLASGAHEKLGNTGEATCEDYPNNVWTLTDGREITEVTCADDF